jgi:uncharacterized protein
MASVKTDRLEALSLEELYALADRTGLDLPPGLERPFVIEEILEVLEDDSEDLLASQGDVLHIEVKKYSGIGIDEIDIGPEANEFIVARYNETMIKAVVRDPSWAFAFWDVSDADMASLRGDEPSAGLFLRVAEASPGGAAPSGPTSTASAQATSESSNADYRREYFDIPVADDDLQWYINLPRSGLRFRIELCARRGGAGGKLRVLARSNEVQSPRQSLALPAVGLDERAYELLALSGAEDIALEDGPESNPLRIIQAGFARSEDRAD